MRNSDRHYNGTTFYDDTKQVIVTHLTKHIPRSLKIENVWCLVFYKDQHAAHRRLLRVLTIVQTPTSEKLPLQMELGEPGQDASANDLSEATSENSEILVRIIVDEPMPEVSLTSKQVGEPKNEDKQNTEKKKKKVEIDTDE